MKRKAWVAIPLLLTLAIISQGLIPPSSAVEYPAIFVDPPSVTGLTPTTGFTVSIKTNYSEAPPDIWGYEFTLTYNPLVLQGVNVTNGDLIVNATAPATFGEGTFDNDAGRLSLTGAYFDSVHGVPKNVTSGPGILANVGFQVVGTGDSPITLGLETRLVDGNGTNIVDARLMPFNIGHGYFRNTAYEVVHDGCALSGTLNDTSLYMGKSVSISVDVKNEGNVKERLEVSIYYRVISPNWLVYNTTVDLANGATENIGPVVWNTDGWFPGKGNITVVVSKVWNETDTSDNELVLGKVHVRILGDINADSTVDDTDYIKLIGVFPDPTPPPANPEADLDFDGTIDEDDFVILVGNLGKSE